MESDLRPLPKLISKTKILQGYQCHKNLYLSLHHRHLTPPVSEELQALFDQGNEVTVAARLRFPEGVLVDFPAFDFGGSLRKTKELLTQQVPVIFEAAFEYRGCYARADIIIYNQLTQRWSVLEVKSSTKVKTEHLDDVGLQAWIMANAGLPIEKISILHINNSCKFPDLDNLFTEVDVTEQLRERHVAIAGRLNEIFKSVRAPLAPEIRIGPHCFEPRECQYFAHCKGAQVSAAEPSVFDVPGFYEQRWKYVAQEKFLLSQLSAEEREELAPLQQHYIKLLIEKGRSVNADVVRKHLSSWKFPLIFLDFETINPAIPIYHGTGPFEQVPFQFSVHRLESFTAEATHSEYLHNETSDPREALAKALLEQCAGEGSVVAYYAKFEERCILNLAENFPALSVELKKLAARLVDPLTVMKEAVYDAAFGASFSLKSVGPALLGELFSYEGMVVADGGSAQRAYAKIMAKSTPPSEKEQLRQALLEYCRKDTLVMVELVKWLSKC